MRRVGLGQSIIHLLPDAAQELGWERQYRSAGKGLRVI